MNTHQIENWQTWARTKENCFAVTGSLRHQFICSDKKESDYAKEFPCSASGYAYTLAEQKMQWGVILEARKWFKAMFLVEHGLAVSFVAALQSIGH